MKNVLLRTCALLSLLPVARAGGVVVFEGPAGGVGNVRVYDEQSGGLLSAPPALQGVQFVTFDHTGHTRLEQFAGDRPRWRNDVPGAARLVLQNDGGCLYHYKRVVPQVGTAFGFMHVTRDGEARSLITLPAIGPQGQGDPFLGRVAVSPNADAFLAATAVEAGGNLLEITLGAQSTVIDRTFDQGPRRFGPDSLALGDTFGVAVCVRGILRFDRAGGAPATAVPFAAAPVPSHFTGQVVLSANAKWAATTAGSGPSALHMYCFDATSPARRATTSADSLSGAGLLPQVEDGPHMAVSDDGTQCAWRVEGVPAQAGATSTEAFTRRVQAPPNEAPAFLTSTTNFTDTLDEVGVLYFHATGALSMAVGEKATPAGNAIEKLDFFDVTLPSGAGTPTFQNMSMSSGDATLPFLGIPTIKPDGMFLTPDRTAIVINDQQSNSVLVHRVGQVGLITLFANVKSMDLVEFSGPYLLISIHRSTGPKPQELYRVPTTFATAPVLVASLPDGGTFDRTAVRRESWVSFIGTPIPSLGDRIGRVQLSSGSFQEFSPVLDILGPVVGRTGLGAFAFSRGTTSSQFVVWPFAGATVQLQVPAGPGFVLPGA